MLSKPLSSFGALVLACMLLGFALGGLAGLLLATDQTHQETGRLAELWLSRADQVSRDISETLAQINQSPFTLCSESDITRLRQLVMQSRFTKTAGRTQNNTLICNSTVGRLTSPAALGAPDLSDGAGNSIWLNSPLLAIPNVYAFRREAGSAQVAYTHTAYELAVDPRVEYIGISELNGHRFISASSGERTALPSISALSLKSGQPILMGGLRYEVRCTPLYHNCVLARLRVDRPLWHFPVVWGFSIAGALAGLSLGFGINTFLRRARSMAYRLKAALRRGELTLMYQPLIRLADGHLVAAEALIRWRDKTDEVIPPDQFIPVAEQSGLITVLTQYVLNHVLEELGALLRNRPDFWVTINLSSQDLLSPDFVTMVSRRLETARVPSSSIGFEITERSTARHAALENAVKRLRSNGHKVYIDDFGTDYSSLSYLAELQIDAVKLDQVFCRGIPEDRRLCVIASQIVAMVRGLGLDLVIEGIEHEPQARYFQQLAPSALGQGWLFSKALPAPDLLVQLDLANASA